MSSLSLHAPSGPETFQCMKGFFVSASRNSSQMIERLSDSSSRKSHPQSNCAMCSPCFHLTHPARPTDAFHFPPAGEGPGQQSAAPADEPSGTQKLSCPYFATPPSVFSTMLLTPTTLLCGEVRCNPLFSASCVPDISQLPSKELVPNAKVLTNGLVTTLFLIILTLPKEVYLSFLFMEGS